MLARAAAVCLVVGLVAGCTDAGSSPEAVPSSSSPAPEPTVDEATGSVSGTVVDEEQRPIAEAVVSLEKVETKTDEAGVFTFNGLDPGSYNLYVTRLGYDQAAKKVTVVAGEVTKAEIVLTPILIVEAYHESFSRTGEVTGQWTVNYLQNTVNNTQLDGILCKCNWIIEFKPKIVDGVTDALFKPAVGGQVVNEVIIIAYNKALTAGSTYQGIMSAEFTANGDTAHWSEAQVNGLKGVPKARLQLHGPDPDHPGIAFQQKVELWQTFAWGEKLPDEFTVLPP